MLKKFDSLKNLHLYVYATCQNGRYVVLNKTYLNIKVV